MTRCVCREASVTVQRGTTPRTRPVQPANLLLAKQTNMRLPGLKWRDFAQPQTARGGTGQLSAGRSLGNAGGDVRPARTAGSRVRRAPAASILSAAVLSATHGSLGAAGAASLEKSREGLRRSASLTASAAAVAAHLRGGGGTGGLLFQTDRFQTGSREPGGGREGGFDIPRWALRVVSAHGKHDARR